VLWNRLYIYIVLFKGRINMLLETLSIGDNNKST
jgi:hypothetical protein